jgi:hypothetical protein
MFSVTGKLIFCTLNNHICTLFVQCVRKVAVLLQKMLEVMSTSVYTGVNWIEQLNTLPVLSTNHCLTTEYSETKAQLNGNFDTDIKYTYRSRLSAQRLYERTVK